MSEKEPPFSGGIHDFLEWKKVFFRYAVLNITGLVNLHALRSSNNTDEWYPMHKHDGEGDSYHYISSQNPEYDEKFTAQVENLAGYPAVGTTAPAKGGQEQGDKNTRRLLAAATGRACGSSTA